MVGKTVCGLFNTIVVTSVAAVRGNVESKRILHIFSCGSQTCTHTHRDICMFLLQITFSARQGLLRVFDLHENIII